MTVPKVFISYSHDSGEHREQVLALSERLRMDGIETYLDRYINGSPAQGWPRWVLDQIDAVDWVLVICSESYYRHFRGHETHPRVDWEGALINQELYDRRSRTVRFVPVLFPGTSTSCIPEPLRAVTYYQLTSEEGYQSLYDFLLNQAGTEARPIGSLKTKARRHGVPLNFGATAAAMKFVCDISRITKYAPVELIGREVELKFLNDAWAKVQNPEKGRSHVLTFVALGGEGKTALVSKWAAELAAQEWPGCDAAFAWSFYSQGTREQMTASSDLFFKEALTFFGDDEEKQFAASNASAFEKGQRLARIVSQRRILLILDGLEPLQYPPATKAFKPGELKDRGIAKLLKDLASTNHGLCIVTTRIEVSDLNAFKGGAVIEAHLKRLPRAAGVSLLKSLGVKGIERLNIPLKDSDPDGEKVNELERLVEDVKGHALTLTLLGGFLKRAFHGDIQQRDRVKFEKADERIDGGHAFRTIAAYEQWLLRDGGDEGQREIAVLRLMGLFDRPADAGCLAALRREIIPGLTEPLAGLADDDWEFCLSGLETAKLLTVNRGASSGLISLDAHPLLREYFARQLRMQQIDAWRAANRLLYEHLCAMTPDKPQPTLDDLQPLYQAVAHGCQAGLHQKALEEVFRKRIQRNENYTLRNLGSVASDLGAIGCFFQHVWSCVSEECKETDRLWLLNEAGYTLRALGRLAEAREALFAADELGVVDEDFGQAAMRASNFSGLELVLGNVPQAIHYARRGVNLADLSNDVFHKITKRARLADALHQANRWEQASELFREAEAFHSEAHPEREILNSMQGFQYCDLMLSSAERTAWKLTLKLTPQGNNITQSVALVATCQNVGRRAERTLNWERYPRDRGGFTIALDRLTLARSSFYQAVFETSDSKPLIAITNRVARQREADDAVNALLGAGQQQYLPLGLLTRAWLRFLSGARTGAESAQEDLDEAWEIAERGPMKLYLADIHLHRARLFVREEEYPWESPTADLIAARKLIEHCGYWRRKEELEDAEEAARNWLPA